MYPNRFVGCCHCCGMGRLLTFHISLASGLLLSSSSSSSFLEQQAVFEGRQTQHPQGQDHPGQADRTQGPIAHGGGQDIAILQDTGGKTLTGWNFSQMIRIVLVLIQNDTGTGPKSWKHRKQPLQLLGTKSNHPDPYCNRMRRPKAPT